MTPRAQYFVQILEKVASPLMSAVIASDQDAGDNGAQAKVIAALLGKAVQSGISIGDLIDISAMGEKSDSMRVALAALSAPLIADTHKQSGKVPDDGALKNISDAMQAVLTFSENFTPSPEHHRRLADLAAQAQVVDLPQIQIQYMQAFVPVIDAVQGFAFGHKETVLIGNISSKLIAQAEDLAASLYGTEDELLHKRVALGVLNSLTQLYATCHVQETARLMAMSDDERAALPKESNGGQSLDHLWEDFGRKAAIMETLAQSIVNGETAAQSGASSKAPDVSGVQSVGDAAVADAPSVVPESSEPPPPKTDAVKPVESPAPASGNPMAMFAKKPTADDDADAGGEAAPAEPAATSPSPETPPPQAAPVEKPVEDTPSAVDNAGDDGGSSGKGNPMSFFKTPPQS